MAVTEEDLKKRQAHNAKLREQILETRARRLANEAQVGNELTAAQLDAEGVALEAELAREREAAKITHVRASSESNLAMAKALMEEAEAAQAAVTTAKEVAEEAKAEAAEAKAEADKDEEKSSPSGAAQVTTESGKGK